MLCRFDCMNTVTALGHSRDARLAAGGQFVALFDSSKQEQELEQLHKEECLVKVHPHTHSFMGGAKAGR